MTNVNVLCLLLFIVYQMMIQSIQYLITMWMSQENGMCGRASKYMYTTLCTVHVYMHCLSIMHVYAFLQKVHVHVL